MINLIAAVICATAMILQICDGNTGHAVLQAVLTVLNLPFAVAWIMKKIKKKR